MTTFNVSLLFHGDASSAAAALKSVTANSDAAKAAVDKLGGSGGDLGPKIVPPLVPVPPLLDNIGASANRTAGYTGNMVAQFQDIGVMMAAGQNPLQLALQQGTQLSMVFSQITADGQSLRSALLGGFVSLLNPISLVTIATIAAGAALVQWLGSASSGATTAIEDIDALAKTVSAYSDNVKIASASSAELQKEFASMGPAARRTSEFLAALDRADAITQMTDAARKLGEEFGGLSRTKLVFTTGGMVKEIEDTYATLREEFALSDAQAAQLTLRLEEMSTAASPEAAIAASQRYSDLLLSIYTSAAAIPAPLRESARAAGELARQGQDILTLDQQLAAAAAARARAAVETYTASRAAGAAAQAEGQSILAGLQQQAAMQQLIATYGRDSVQVRQAERDAEVATMAARLDGLAISGELRQSILDAVAATTDSASATEGWASAMAGVGAEISGILSALASISGGVISNASKQIEIDALRAGQSVAAARRTAVEAEITAETDARLAGARNVVERIGVIWDRGVKLRGVALDAELAAEKAAASKRDRPAAASGASGGAGRAANALEQLMARQQAELDILRATDPVQKEMLRNREALALATADERATIEGLIAQRIAEQAQMQALQQGWDMIGQSAYQALDQIIVQGKSARDVVANLAGSLASAALQSAILGKGPLSGFFGTAGTGGLLGMIFPALRKADGGRIAGPGTGRSDSIAAWLSNGEYVVNAAATARNLPLLEAINSNRAPRFADGGLVAGPPIRATGGGVGTAGAAAEQIVVVLQLSDDLDARIEAASSRVAVRAVRAGVRQYDKAMPARVSQISQDPRAR